MGRLWAGAMFEYRHRKSMELIESFGYAYLNENEPEG